MAQRKEIEDDMTRRHREPKFIDDLVERVHQLIDQQADERRHRSVSDEPEGQLEKSLCGLVCSGITEVLVDLRYRDSDYQAGFSEAMSRPINQVRVVWEFMIKEIIGFSMITEEGKEPEFAKEYFDRVLLKVHDRLFNKIRNDIGEVWQRKYPLHLS
jgi:hypothetical protein